MPFEAGIKLGAYEVLSLLGTRGMREVYGVRKRSGQIPTHDGVPQLAGVAQGGLMPSRQCSRRHGLLLSPLAV